MITVAQLPDQDRTRRTLPNGAIVEGTPTILHCRECGAQYSATRGDYFLLPPNTPLRCGQCEAPLTLATVHTVIVPIGGHHA